MAPNTERRLTRYFELVSFMVSFPYQPRWESNSARWLGCRFEAVDVFFIRNEPVPLFVKGIFDTLKQLESSSNAELCLQEDLIASPTHHAADLIRLREVFSVVMLSSMAIAVSKKPVAKGATVA